MDEEVSIDELQGLAERELGIKKERQRICKDGVEININNGSRLTARGCGIEDTDMILFMEKPTEETGRTMTTTTSTCGSLLLMHHSPLWRIRVETHLLARLA